MLTFHALSPPMVKERSPSLERGCLINKQPTVTSASSLLKIKTETLPLNLLIISNEWFLTFVSSLDCTVSLRHHSDQASVKCTPSVSCGTKIHKKAIQIMQLYTLTTQHYHRTWTPFNAIVTKLIADFFTIAIT